MATAPFTSNVVSGNWDQTWKSKNSAIFSPIVYEYLYKKFGRGAELLETLKVLGRKIYVPKGSITTFEREAPERSIKTGAAIATGAAGASISLVLHADNFDANGNKDLRVGDTVYIPAKYVSGTVTRGYRVHSFSTTTLTNDTALCYPYSGDGNTITASQITTEIPSGTWLSAPGPNTHTDGAGQPEGLNDSWGTLTHKTANLKATFKIEGGANASNYHKPIELDMGGGQKFVTSYAALQAEFNLDSQEDFQLWLGEQNDNTSMTETSAFSGSQVVPSGKGLWQWANEYAQPFSYTAQWDYSDFYDIGRLFESQHVMATMAYFMMGPELNRFVEESGLDFIKEYSGGSDLLDKMTNKLGVTINVARIGDIEYVFKVMRSWANPNKLGMYINDTYAYEFPTGGLIIPDEDITVSMGGDKTKTINIPNVNVMYVNNNGENRERMFGLEVGVNGMGYGTNVANDKDGIKGYFSSDLGLIGGSFNKLIQVLKA